MADVDSHCSGLPLGSDIDDSVFKLAFLDVGLASHLCGLAWRDISDADDTRLVNEGGMAEQYVAQQLASFGKGKPELTYWHREGRQGNAEIDTTARSRRCPNNREGTLKMILVLLIVLAGALAHAHATPEVVLI